VTDQHLVPNHHAHYPSFRGLAGLAAALSMVVGRDSDARYASQLADLGPDDVVVDVGCGPGVAVRHAARLGVRATGIDPAPVMLRTARLLTWGGDNVRYVEGVAEALPVGDHCATVVWSIATVHHWSDLDAGLAEARRVLRPGGHLVAIERRTYPGAHGHASHGWTNQQAETFADRCREHGFDAVCVQQDTTGRRSTLSVVATNP